MRDETSLYHLSLYLLKARPDSESNVDQYRSNMSLINLFKYPGKARHGFHGDEVFRVLSVIHSCQHGAQNSRRELGDLLCVCVLCVCVVCVLCVWYVCVCVCVCAYISTHDLEYFNSSKMKKNVIARIIAEWEARLMIVQSGVEICRYFCKMS